MKYHTDFKYWDRESKARYILKKYDGIFQESILDIGADQCFLRKHLDKNIRYVGIGKGDSRILDSVIDLEEGRLPFNDGEFFLTICSDVLEHLDNPQDVFREICRVTSGYVVISLPNPYAVFIRMLMGKKYCPEKDLKFYGLQHIKPDDRHKWFFSSKDAVDFIIKSASANQMEVVQIDFNENRPTLFDKIRFGLVELICGIKLNYQHYHAGTVWALIKKRTH